MSDIRRLQSVKKDELEKSYGDLGVLIAEDDFDEIITHREWMKSLYVKYREAHREFHETLHEEAAIKASDVSFRDAQNVYSSQQNAAKAALNCMKTQQQMKKDEQSFQTLGQLINLPPLELKKFSGEPDDFDDFMTTFHEVVGKIVTDPASKLLRLKSEVTGIASESIKMCRMDDGEDGYKRAVKILYDRFGSPYIVCNSVIERLKYGPDVRSPGELRTFSDELVNAEITLKKNEMYTEIDTQNNIIEICHRLESCIRYEWRRRVMKNKQSTGVYMNFSDFVIFIQEQADIVNDPLYGKDVLEDRPNKSRMRKSVSSSLVSTKGTTNSSSISESSVQSNSDECSSMLCHLCSKNHKLYACYRFRNMPIDERCNYVNANSLCILCLGKDHSVAECRSTYTCKVNNCGQKHSSSLHVYNNNPLTGLATRAQPIDLPDVYMPTVPVVINDTLETFALLDTGSNASFCSRNLMNSLKLQGSNTSYQLKTLHGSNTHCSEIVDIQVLSRNGTASLKMNNVFVVDKIPVDGCSVGEITKYPHLKDLTFEQALQVDLIIGQDNSAALAPIEVRHGPVGTPFAVRTMMGWSLNGCASLSDRSQHVTSNCISTTRLEEDVHQLERTEEAHIPLDTFGMSLNDQMSVVVNSPQTHVPWKRSLAVEPERWYFTLFKMCMILLVYVCLMWFLYGCRSSLDMFSLSLYGYTIGHFSTLEALYASMGGVLLLVYRLSCVVPYCVYISTVSHRIATMISDATEYTLYY